MKKRIITIIMFCVVVALSLSMFSACTKLNENLLTTDGHGHFLISETSDLENEFILETADTVTDYSTVFAMEKDENEGSEKYYNINIDTSTPKYASIAQTVSVTAGSYYTVSYSLKIDSIDSPSIDQAKDGGIYLDIVEDEDLDFKSLLLNGNKDFETFEYSFKAQKTGDATIRLNFGSEENPASIKASLGSFSVKRVSRNDANKSGYTGVMIPDVYGQAKPFNIFYIVMGAFASVVLCVAAYIMLRRHMSLSDPTSPKRYKNNFLLRMEESGAMNIGIIVGIGLCIRLLIDILSTAIAAQFKVANVFISYNAQGLATQALFIAKYGPQNLLHSAGGAFATDGGYTVSSVTSSPLQLYVLGFAGLFGRIFEKSNPYMATLFFIRFFAALADIGAALVLYSIVKKQVGQIGATIVAVLYLALPIVFAASSLWGYMDSITAFLIILTVKFMLENKYIHTAVTFFIAFMFSQTALFMAPFVLFYTVLVCIKAVINKEYRNLIAACCILVLSFFVYYALSVPFAYNNIRDGKAFYWFTYSWNELYTGALYTINAFNFQAILGNNLVAVSTASTAVTIIFILFMLALVGLAYFKFKNRMNLVLLATAFINMMFVFGNQMKPMSMFISLIMMLMYAVMNKEKRVFFCFIAFAALMFINVSYCELMINFASTTAPNWYGKLAVMYVFSSFELIFALYYVYIVYDIVVSRKVLKMAPLAMTFPASVKNFFLRIAKKYYELRSKN